MDRELAIREIIRRLAGYFRPEQIYLFGSAARGEARPDSDPDFLVVRPDDAPRALLLSGREYEQFSGIPVSADSKSKQALFHAQQAIWTQAPNSTAGCARS